MAYGQYSSSRSGVDDDSPMNKRRQRSGMKPERRGIAVCAPRYVHGDGRDPGADQFCLSILVGEGVELGFVTHQPGLLAGINHPVRHFRGDGASALASPHRGLHSRPDAGSRGPGRTAGALSRSQRSRSRSGRCHVAKRASSTSVFCRAESTRKSPDKAPSTKSPPRRAPPATPGRSTRNTPFAGGEAHAWPASSRPFLARPLGIQGCQLQGDNRPLAKRVALGEDPALNRRRCQGPDGTGGRPGASSR